MSNNEVFRPFFNGELTEAPNGGAVYNKYKYTRKRSAYIRRAKDIATHTKEEWLSLVSIYSNKCCKCHCEVIGGIPTKDHIIPPYWGGSDSIKNIQPLCRQCNIKKGRKSLNWRVD